MRAADAHFFLRLVGGVSASAVKASASSAEVMNEENAATSVVCKCEEEVDGSKTVAAMSVDKWLVIGFVRANARRELWVSIVKMTGAYFYASVTWGYRFSDLVILRFREGIGSNPIGGN